MSSETASNSKKNIVTIFVLALGAVVVYFLPYLRWTLFDPLQQAVGLDAGQFAATMSLYGVTAMIFYAPGGYFADKFSPRKMLALAYLSTGLLGFWYTTYPPFWTQMLIFGLWGAIGTAFMWSSMLKVANSLGGEEQQGRLFGFLEGGRGVINVVLAFAAVGAFSALGEQLIGITGIIVVTSALCILSALLVWIVVPSELQGSAGSKIQFEDVGRVLKIPMVWVNAIVVLTCYSVYIGSTYLTPYMTEVLGVTASAAGIIAILRSYVLQFVAAPVGGTIADKIGSVPRVIAACFVIIVAALTAFIVFPEGGSIIIPVALMILFCAGIFAMRGIYFAPIDSAGVPKNLVGTAIGVISVIGFLPDVYMNAIAGAMQTSFPGADGYLYIFIIMLAFATVGLVAAIVMDCRLKRRKASII